MPDGHELQHPTQSGMADRLIALASDPLNRAITALGITQIIAWGTTLYLLGVLGKPIALETGWSQGFVFGGLTVALLVAGAVSSAVGRWIDRRGGRDVMTVGSMLVAISLALLSEARSPATYLAAWALTGLAMRMMLYDAAFAALVQLAPARGRRAISLLTLFGGLASTILWPVGALLEHHYGWRMTVLAFAALNLLVCAPLHWFGLARGGDAARAAPADTAINPVPTSPPLIGAQRRSAMILFSIVMGANAIVTGALAAHLLPILASTGLDARAAVALASTKGVAQTLARLVDLVFGRNLHAITLGRVTIALLPLAFVLLVVGGSGWIAAVGFVLVFGASNGLSTIVRGAMPLTLFGAQGYGEVLGKLAIPVLVMNAVAPTLFALIADSFGQSSAVMLLVVFALLAFIAMEVMAHWWRRTQP